MTHGRINAQSFSIVGVFVASQAAENRLAKQGGQTMTGVLSGPHIGQPILYECRQPQRLVQFPIGQQPGVAGDPCPMEFEPQFVVEIDP
jgi:hypothetical protein